MIDLDLTVTEAKRSMLGPSVKVIAQHVDEMGYIRESGPRVEFWISLPDDVPKVGYRVQVRVGPAPHEEPTDDPG